MADSSLDLFKRASIALGKRMTTVRDGSEYDELNTELQLINAEINAINTRPGDFPLPSDDDLKKMRAVTAELARAVEQAAMVDTILKSATALLEIYNKATA